MRKVMLLCAAAVTTALAGCSTREGPVVVTPEVEAEQKLMEKKAHDSESARQKDQKRTGKPTADDEERRRQK